MAGGGHGMAKACVPSSRDVGTQTAEAGARTRLEVELVLGHCADVLALCGVVVRYTPE